MFVICYGADTAPTAGLKNPDNQCYFNAAMQFLNSIHLIREWAAGDDGDRSDTVRTRFYELNQRRGDVIQMVNRRKGQVCDMKRAIGILSNTEQGDAHEVITNILDILPEPIKKAFRSFYAVDEKGKCGQGKLKKQPLIEPMHFILMNEPSVAFKEAIDVKIFDEVGYYDCIDPGQVPIEEIRESRKQVDTAVNTYFNLKQKLGERPGESLADAEQQVRDADKKLADLLNIDLDKFERNLFTCPAALEPDHSFRFEKERNPVFGSYVIVLDSWQNEAGKNWSVPESRRLFGSETKSLRAVLLKSGNTFNGHYITLFRHDKQWWEANDDSVSKIDFQEYFRENKNKTYPFVPIHFLYGPEIH